LQKPPKGECKELGVRSYTRSRREDLVKLINLPWRAKDDEIRRLCRLEFNAFSSDEQWRWAQDQKATAVSNGSGGRFQNHVPAAVFAEGAEVKLHGLVGRSELNGSTGTCQEFIPESERWRVVLKDDQVTLNVKPGNLELVAAPEACGSTSTPLLLWSECEKHCDRKKRLREAINRAAGGREPLPQEVAKALSKTLTSDKQAACAWYCDADKEAAQAMIVRS